MKFIGRVSLFFIIGILGFAVGIYASWSYQEHFYPNKNAESRMQPYALEDDKSRTEQTENLQVTQQPEAVITCDTAFIVEEYNKNTDTVAAHEEEIPGKYMGMDRASFVDAMCSYEMCPPLEEQKRGLVSVEVLSFAPNRVLIRKNYERKEEEPEKIFYLVAEDHYITVYTEDMQSIYLYTDINMEELPVSLQEEIIQKKLISGESSLYHFLESYSS